MTQGALARASVQHLFRNHHTVAVTPEGPWVLTAEDGGVAGLAPFGITPRS